MSVWIVFDMEDYAYTGAVYATKEAAIKSQRDLIIDDDYILNEVEVIE